MAEEGSKTTFQDEEIIQVRDSVTVVNTFGDDSFKNDTTMSSNSVTKSLLVGNPIEYCNEVKKLSYAVMNARQVGLNISDVVTNKLSRLDIEVQQDVIMEIIVESHGVPIYTEDVSRQIIARKFEETNFLKCVEIMLKKPGGAVK